MLPVLSSAWDSFQDYFHVEFTEPGGYTNLGIIVLALLGAIHGSIGSLILSLISRVTQLVALILQFVLVFSALTFNFFGQMKHGNEWKEQSSGVSDLRYEQIDEKAPKMHMLFSGAIFLLALTLCPLAIRALASA